MNQQCVTRPAVVKITIEYLREVLWKTPRTEIVSVSKNNIQEVLHRERCRKLREADGSDVANRLILVNQVAEAIVHLDTRERSATDLTK